MNRMVAEVMTSPVVSVQPGTSFKAMVEVLTKHQIGALPVLDSGGHLMGIVSETDLVQKEERSPSGRSGSSAGSAKLAKPVDVARAKAADFMSTPAITIPQGASLASAARLLRERNVRHLPVVAPDGRIVGIVARRDLLSVFLQAGAAISRTINFDVLRGRFNLPAGAINVDVNEGVVTLAGRTPWRSTAREVVERVRALDGVVDVIDRLSWTHDDSANHIGARRPGSPVDQTRPRWRRSATAWHRPSIIWTRD